MKIKIGFASYGYFTKYIEKLRPIFQQDIEFIVYEKLFEISRESIYEIESMRNVDIFVASGSNYKHLYENLREIPVVEVKVTGFDILNAIKNSNLSNNKIAIITLDKCINYLSSVKELINVNIYEFVYKQTIEIDSLLNKIYDMGIKDIIGSAYIIERAEAMGFRGQLIWSMDGIENAIHTANNIVKSKNIDNEKTKKLNSILQFSHEGIIVTDKNGIITEFNKSAENITGIKAVDIIGSDVREKLTNTRLHIIMSQKKQELNEIQQIGNVKVLTNRTPIIYDGEVIGAVAAFQNINAITEADNKIKRSLYDKGFVAKFKFEDIVGISEEIKSIIRISKLYAKTESNILINGESGTGKDLFAQSIHNESLRSKEPFVAVNCAAIHSSLLESELFGYEEGAFTGAKKGGRMGIFEIANQGTIFLDEIGELSMEIQSKLLRVLEQGQILRVGGEKIIHTNIRVIAATNKNLWKSIKEGTFREDLYYRLNILEVIIPPLRDRRSDIPRLIKYFISEFNLRLSSDEINNISHIDLFFNYDWPGNVRELKNVVERFCVLYEKGTDIAALAEKVLVIRNKNDEEINEKDIILKTLDECNGSKSVSSQNLGISRTTLWRKMKKYKI